MFFRRIFMAGLVMAICTTAASAQQQPNTTQNQTSETKEQQGRRGFGGQGRAFGRERGPRGLFDPRVLRELNLTDDQQRQIGQIVSANFENTKSQREQLHEVMEKRRAGRLTADDEARAKTLREQLQTSMKDSETKIAAVLTTEQKAKLEEIMKERRQSRERFRDRRREGSPPLDQTTSPSQKPTNPTRP